MTTTPEKEAFEQVIDALFRKAVSWKDVHKTEARKLIERYVDNLESQIKSAERRGKEAVIQCIRNFKQVHVSPKVVYSLIDKLLEVLEKESGGMGK